MKKFKVSRKRWARGGVGSLKTDTGQMCCLGFVCAAAGAKRGSMKNAAMPDDLIDMDNHENRNELLESKLKELDLLSHEGDNTQLAKELARVNDSSDFHGKVREERLNQILKNYKVDWRFKFVD